MRRPITSPGIISLNHYTTNITFCSDIRVSDYALRRLDSLTRVDLLIPVMASTFV